jgi:hypothetical protein
VSSSYVIKANADSNLKNLFSDIKEAKISIYHREVPFSSLAVHKE